MIGASPCYVGLDAVVQLTESLHHRPFSILLFDEVEKTAKEVFTVLLQLMDDGRITDGQGRIVDVKNCIVVMTSNLGTEHLSHPTTKDGQLDLQTREMEICKIVDLRLSEVQKYIEGNGHNVDIQCTEEVKEYFGAAGYSPAYGPHPLARLIERKALNRLAVLILRSGIKDGEFARVVLRDGRLDVLPNHNTPTESDGDEAMTDSDSDSSIDDMEDGSGDMDLYDD